MNHLNAGEIHAWLDGAVDATQAREIETHVAQCSACAAAVAEARGYIAASSRILNALDDVPAGVTPKQAPRTPSRPPAPTRQWRAAPWVTGIAAALVLAVGITTWNRRAVQEEMPATGAASAARQEVESIPPVVVPAPQQAPQQAPLVGVGSEPVLSAPANKPTQRDASAKASNRARVVETRPRTAGVLGGGVVSTAPRLPMPSGAGADIRGPISKSAIGGVARPLSDQKIANAVVTEASPAPAAAPEARTRDVTKLRSVRRTERVEESADVDELIGCYRVADTTRFRSASPNIGAIAGKAARRSAAAPSMAPSAVYAAPQQAMLRLDTARAPVGYVVRSATSDSVIGWWMRVGSDSARVQLLNAARLQIGRKDQVACPER